MVDFAISVKDMEYVDGFTEAFNKSVKGFPQHYRIEQDVESRVFVEDSEILTFLYKSGMDIKKPIEVANRRHRTLHNEVVTGIRFEGHERLDDKWIKSGAASMDALIASMKDHSMEVTLSGMNAEYTVDKSFD